MTGELSWHELSKFSTATCNHLEEIIQNYVPKGIGSEILVGFLQVILITCRVTSSHIQTWSPESFTRKITQDSNKIPVIPVQIGKTKQKKTLKNWEKKNLFFCKFLVFKNSTVHIRRINKIILHLANYMCLKKKNPQQSTTYSKLRFSIARSL